MNRRAPMILAALAASLVLGADQAFAWQKDRDVAVDPSNVNAIVTRLLAPDPTLGSTDATVPGVGLDAVGINGSLSDPPADPADSSPGTTYFVDNTPTDGDCPPTPYTTIQAGVNASGSGDTVKVCPGTYLEQVQISGHLHDGLKLESVKPLQAVIQWPTVETSHQLVTVNGADGVSIRGFTITGPFTSGGCSIDRHEGVQFENEKNGRLDYNHITLIRDIDPLLWGCQQGDAVAIGRRLDLPFPPLAANPGSARVDHNLIDKCQKNGTQAVNKNSAAQIDHNVITASTEPALQAVIASNGVSVFRNAAATVDHNVISKNKFTPSALSTGIILDEAPPGSSRIDHNRVFDNDFGIEADTETNLEISHNDVFQNLGDAITVCGDVTQGCGPATDIAVRANDVENNGSRGGTGVLLLGASDNLLKANQVKGNGQSGPDTTDGIRLDSNSKGNEVLNNQLQGNVTHDCHDDSTGTGTGGTANTWQGNQGQTQNRPGLCEPAPPCPEGDGNGHFQGNNGDGNIQSDSDGCRDGDEDQVNSDNRGDGKDFHSTKIESTSVNSLGNTMTITGAGTSAGVPVTFVLVEVESTPLTPGSISMSFSDGFTNAGDLLDGSILLH